MFEIALVITIFSYSIFLLGLAGFLYPPIIILFTLLFITGGLYYYQHTLLAGISHLVSLPQKSFSLFFKLCLLIFCVQSAINLVGVFGPELGFDALWYHLTLPKLYLQYHALVHVPGGLLYYSDMPKLVEMLYTAALSFGTDILAHGIHFTFGILCCIATYKVARKFLNPSLSILAVVIFYTNLLVGWESISAYVDLGRTFFELVGVLSFLSWTTTKQQRYFFYTALLIGMAITTKMIAVGTLGIFLIFLYFELQKLSFTDTIKQLLLFVGIALLVPLPWFIFAFLHTGNPFYPLFSSAYPIINYLQLLNPWNAVQSMWTLFTHSPDPISPLYIAVLPVVIVRWKYFVHYARFLLLYSILGLVVWYITPQTGGGRFILPFLPIWSIFAIVVISTSFTKRWITILLTYIFITVFLSLGYRAIANAKFLPVILGRESKATFLTKHLNFSFGDFYDTDGYFARTIKPTDRVLLYGFHNLYYVNFPFIDNSWVQKGNVITYIAVQGTGMPARFQYIPLVYFNPLTQVRVYSLGGNPWRY